MQIIKFEYTEENLKKYLPGIMDIEKSCFPVELCEEEEDVIEMLKDYLCFIGLIEGQVVSVSYAQFLNKMTSEDFDGFWDPKTYKHFSDNNTYYISSTAVHADHQGLGGATYLKLEMNDYLRNQGIKYVIGHAEAGTMMNIVKRLGGEIVQEFDNWYNSGEKHDLYELNIWKQSEDYNCGTYALWMLFYLNGFNQEAPVEMEIEMETNREDGTYNQAMKEYIDDRHIKFTEGNESTIDVLKNNLPAVVNYQEDGDGHYGVITEIGYNMKIYNPAVGDIIEMTVEDFSKNWYSKRYNKRWFLSIVK